MSPRQTVSMTVPFSSIRASSGSTSSSKSAVRAPDGITHRRIGMPSSSSSRTPPAWSLCKCVSTSKSTGRRSARRYDAKSPPYSPASTTSTCFSCRSTAASASPMSSCIYSVPENGAGSKIVAISTAPAASIGSRFLRFCQRFRLFPNGSSAANTSSQPSTTHASG